MSSQELKGVRKCTKVQHVSSFIPGRDIVQVLTELPVNVSSGWRHHSGDEVGYILAGTVQMEREDRTTHILHTGDGFNISPGVPHNVTNLGPDTARMLSTYVVEQGRPTSTPET